MVRVTVLNPPLQKKGRSEAEEERKKIKLGANVGLPNSLKDVNLRYGRSIIFSTASCPEVFPWENSVHCNQERKSNLSAMYTLVQSHLSAIKKCVLFYRSEWTFDLSSFWSRNYAPFFFVFEGKLLFGAAGSSLSLSRHVFPSVYY